MLALGGSLGGCAAFPALKLPTPAVAKPAASAPGLEVLAPKVDHRFDNDAAAPPEAIAALSTGAPEKLDVELPPQPLPQMLNTVFGGILHTPYVLGPDVSVRTDYVSLRGVSGMGRKEFIHLLQVALHDYGLKVVIHAGTVNIVTDVTPNISSATYLGSRPSQDTPQSAQMVTEPYQARALNIQDALTLMADVNPGARSLSMTPDVAANSVVITGRARDVNGAITMLRELDQPMFAGVGVVRVEPVYWSAPSLGKSLEDTLRSEGDLVTGSPQTPRTILVMAFGDVNQVLLFAKDPALLNRARDWVTRLDRPEAVGDKPATFIYQAQNTDAKSLADLAQTPESGFGQAPGQLVGLPGTPPAATTAANTVNSAAGVGRATISANGSSSQTGSPGSFLNGRIIVDTPGNRVLFTGTAEDFTQLRSLLVALDTPQRQVLVEVTIAEVTLNDQTNIGLEWFFNQSMSGGNVLSGGTQGGLGIGASGLNLNFTGKLGSANLQAAFNAFASNNKVNILSRPRLVARSGSEASIQVGTDLPIITSQANSPTQTSGSTNILQTVEYRQTGTILHIKPLIYGDDRVDLTVTQEVSSAAAGAGAAGSPIILDRNITTQLSLADGATAVLGGLMDDEYSKTNSGIPILKDIPILGSLARTDSITGDKTELVMLVTPYILHEGDDMGHWARQYSHELNDAYRVGHGWSYTLTAYAPWLGLKDDKTKP